MARKLKMMENEKHRLDDLKNDKITKKREKLEMHSMESSALEILSSISCNLLLMLFRYELSKTRNAMADIHSRVSDELYKKKQERSKDYER